MLGSHLKHAAQHSGNSRPHDTLTPYVGQWKNRSQSPLRSVSTKLPADGEDDGTEKPRMSESSLQRELDEVKSRLKTTEELLNYYVRQSAMSENWLHEMKRSLDLAYSELNKRPQMCLADQRHQMKPDLNMSQDEILNSIRDGNEIQQRLLNSLESLEERINMSKWAGNEVAQHLEKTTKHRAPENGEVAIQAYQSSPKERKKKKKEKRKSSKSSERGRDSASEKSYKRSKSKKSERKQRRASPSGSGSVQKNSRYSMLDAQKLMQLYAAQATQQGYTMYPYGNPYDYFMTGAVGQPQDQIHPQHQAPIAPPQQPQQPLPHSSWFIPQNASGEDAESVDRPSDSVEQARSSMPQGGSYAVKHIQQLQRTKHPVHPGGPGGRQSIPLM